MGTRTGDEVDTQEEADNNEEIEDFGSHLNSSSSTHEDAAPLNVEDFSSDQFGAVRTINTAASGMQPSGDFITKINSDLKTEATRFTRSVTTLR